MIIEQKIINSTELLLFFLKPLPILGSFYYDQNTSEDLQLIKNIAQSNLAKTLLLTSDFLYLQSKEDINLDDLKTIALAELDDYAASAPKTQTAPINSTETKATIILKTIVAPFLQKDGGDIKLIEYKDGIAYVKFLGKCNGCPYAQKTLKDKVEKNLIRYLPEIKEATLI